MAPEVEEPSPKLQEYEYGGVPPVALDVKVTDCPMLGLAGENAKLAPNEPGGMVSPTVKVYVKDWPAFNVLKVGSLKITVEFLSITRFCIPEEPIRCVKVRVLLPGTTLSVMLTDVSKKIPALVGSEVNGSWAVNMILFIVRVASSAVS